MKASDLNKEARAYARTQLGEAQFKTQKWAVRAICADYKAGFARGFAAGQQAPTPAKLAPQP